MSDKKQNKTLQPGLTTINEIAPPSPSGSTQNPPDLVPQLLTWIQNTKRKQFQDFHLFCVTIISTSSF